MAHVEQFILSYIFQVCINFGICFNQTILVPFFGVFFFLL